MEKYKENVYFVIQMEDNALTKQLEWSKSALNNNNELHKLNFALYQGQLINYLHFDVRLGKFIKSIAICLEDSDEYSNSAVICPLIEGATFKDFKLGINIGKIIGLASDLDHIAFIPAIHSISKDYILVNDEYNNNVYPTTLINNIINCYRNFLKNLIIKHSKIREGNIS